jgi:hypothetical protein
VRKGFRFVGGVRMPDRSAIAVLRFTNMSDDAELAWIAEHVPVTQDDRDSEAFRRARDHYLEAYRRAGME